MFTKKALAIRVPRVDLSPIAERDDADEENKEYFVYCPICGIETAETYTSKAKALKAFADGKTKPISGKEAGGGE